MSLQKFQRAEKVTIKNPFSKLNGLECRVSSYVAAAGDGAKIVLVLHDIVEYLVYECQLRPGWKDDN